ncbi:hypothetical protein S83_001751 [Arachis hypogaea]
MSLESVTDHAISPDDLAKLLIEALIDIIRVDEKPADYDLIEATLVRMGGDFEGKTCNDRSRTEAGEGGDDGHQVHFRGKEG